MNPILRIIIIIINFTLAYFLVREIIKDITVNQYIISIMIIIFTGIISIFTTSKFRIERRMEVYEDPEEETNNLDNE